MPPTPSHSLPSQLPAAPPVASRESAEVNDRHAARCLVSSEAAHRGSSTQPSFSRPTQATNHTSPPELAAATDTALFQSTPAAAHCFFASFLARLLPTRPGAREKEERRRGAALSRQRTPSCLHLRLPAAFDLDLGHQPPSLLITPPSHDRPSSNSTAPRSHTTLVSIVAAIMKSASLAVAAAYLVAAVAAQASNTRTAGIEAPSAAPTAGAAVVQGCFSSHGDLEFNSNETYNSIGKCGSQICNQALGKYVGATTQGKECWCGNTYPPQSSRVDDSYCDAPCTGWPHDACASPLPTLRVASHRLLTRPNRRRRQVLDRLQHGH